VRIIRIVAVAATILVGCVHSGQAQDVPAVQSDLTVVQAEIKAAQAEDAKYSGGLVKSLIVARIEILHQTEAMLQQKLLALKNGVRVQYTVDGRAFSLPLSAKEMLADVDSEIGLNEAKIKAQEAEVARYSGGLVQAMAISTLATMRQTQAMLGQKRVALKYGLPQYLGFANATTKEAIAAAPEPLPATGGTGKPLDDVLRKALALSVIEKGFIPSDPQSRRYQDLLTFTCSYENTSDKDIRAHTGTVIFQDLFGKEIYRATITISDPIAVGRRATWKGSARYNQFTEAHQRFRATELRDMKVVWAPASIIFADGTREKARIESQDQMIGSLTRRRSNSGSDS
jgi:hypothetical protein